jgi:hypothetical protein
LSSVSTFLSLDSFFSSIFTSIFGKILQFSRFFVQLEQNVNKKSKKVTKNKGFLCIFFWFNLLTIVFIPDRLASMNNKGDNTMNINKFNEMMTTMTIKDLNNMKSLIDTMIKNKVKDTMVVGMKVNIVQKTKKTSGVIKKIMQSKCLVTIDNGTTYRVPMSMLEAA